MRRKDREVSDPREIDGIIGRCDCCRVGFLDGDRAYIVPMNFGYERGDGGPRFYFHCAAEGKKLRLAARNPAVGFELDTGRRLREGTVGCDCSFCFESVVGAGTIAVVAGRAEKRAALRLILRCQTGRDDWTLPDGAVEGVTVLRLDVEELACKRHL